MDRAEPVIVTGFQIGRGASLEQAARYGPADDVDRGVLREAEPHPAGFALVSVIVKLQGLLRARRQRPVGLKDEIALQMVRDLETLLDAPKRERLAVVNRGQLVGEQRTEAACEGVVEFARC